MTVSRLDLRVNFNPSDETNPFLLVFRPPDLLAKARINSNSVDEIHVDDNNETQFLAVELGNIL